MKLSKYYHTANSVTDATSVTGIIFPMGYASYIISLESINKSIINNKTGEIQGLKAIQVLEKTIRPVNE